MSRHPVADPEWEDLLARDAHEEAEQHRQELRDRHGPPWGTAEATPAKGGVRVALAGVASAAPPARPNGAPEPSPPGAQRGGGTNGQCAPNPSLGRPATGPGTTPIPTVTTYADFAAFLRAHLDLRPEQRHRLAALRLAYDVEHPTGRTGFHAKKAPRGDDAGATTSPARRA